MGDQKLSDLGEHALLARLTRRIAAVPPPDVGPGDDAAVVSTPGRVVWTTDMLVEDVDFDLAYASPADVGWKTMAANASDVAAMGGRPRWVLVAAGIPPDTPLASFDGLLDGLLEAAAHFDISLVGGDLGSAPALVVAASIAGTIDGRAVLRSGARPGDSIAVTGSLGGARAGFLALRDGKDPGARLRQRQLRPVPPLGAGPALAAAGATAMIDLSDGFAVDLERVLDASGAGCEVDDGAIPLDPDAATVADSLECALVGGEDFELLATLPRNAVESAVAACREAGTTLTVVGKVVAAGRRTIGGRDLAYWRERGWEHLRTP